MKAVFHKHGVKRMAPWTFYPPRDEEGNRSAPFTKDRYDFVPGEEVDLTPKEFEFFSDPMNIRRREIVDAKELTAAQDEAATKPAAGTAATTAKDKDQKAGSKS